MTVLTEVLVPSGRHGGGTTRHILEGFPMRRITALLVSVSVAAVLSAIAPAAGAVSGTSSSVGLAQLAPAAATSATAQPAAIETTFAVDPPAPLSDVAAALRAADASPVSFSHRRSGWVGGSVVGELDLDAAVAKYQADYAEFAPGQPQIFEFTVSGSLPTVALGQLAGSITERRELDPASIPAPAPEAASNAPEGFAAAATVEQFAPAFGRIVTSDGSINPLRRVIIHDLTWENQASIDAFGEEAYEHDLKLFNDANVGPSVGGVGTRPLCVPGQGDRFWATRNGTYETTFPDAAKPYFDTDISDSCKTQDLTIGLYHPDQLVPGERYVIVIRVDAGSEGSSPYALTAQQLERVPGCERPICVGTNTLDDDPFQPLVGREKGNAPECRDWRKGEESTLCAPDPPPTGGAPSVDAGPTVSGDRNTPIALAGSASDPNNDPLTINWTFSPGAGTPAGASCSFGNASQPATTITCDTVGNYVATLTANDGTNPSVSDSATVIVRAPNRPPVVDAGPPVSGNEGSPIQLSGSASDPDGDPVDTFWSIAGSGVDSGATCSFSDRDALSPQVTCTDDGTYIATLSAYDGVNSPVTDSTLVTVANVSPTVTITAPVDGVFYGVNIHPVTVRGTFADPGANDTHTCTVGWADGTTTAGGLDQAARTCSATHMFSTVGTYTIEMRIADDDGGSGSDTVTVVVRDNTIAGSATALGTSVPTLLGPIPVRIGQTLPPQGGGPFASSLIGLNLPGLLRLDVLSASTEGQRSGASAFVRSSASVAKVDLLNGTVLIDSLASNCLSTGSGSTGSATLARLVVTGQTFVDMQPAPNTQIPIPGGVLVLNEQTRTTRLQIPHPLGGFTQFGETSLVVTGARLHLTGADPATDVILSQSQCLLEGPAVTIQ